MKILEIIPYWKHSWKIIVLNGIYDYRNCHTQNNLFQYILIDMKKSNAPKLTVHFNNGNSYITATTEKGTQKFRVTMYSDEDIKKIEEAQKELEQREKS